MFVLGNFLQTIAGILDLAITFFWWLVIIRALLSWVNPDPNNMIVQFIERATDPLLYPFRQIIPTYKLGIDLSPILAILFLFFLRSFVVKTILEFAARLS